MPSSTTEYHKSNKITTCTNAYTISNIKPQLTIELLLLLVGSTAKQQTF